MNFEGIIGRYKTQLGELYDRQSKGEDAECGDTDVLDEIEKILMKDMQYLGWIYGEIDGAGISSVLNNYYYLYPNPLDGRWHLMVLWYDDNWGRWQFNGVGSIPAADLSVNEAAYELMKRFAEAGTDEESIENRKDLIEEWRRISEGGA